jgi:uncharacterized protein YyaL (SSP411 family)
MVKRSASNVNSKMLSPNGTINLIRFSSITPPNGFVIDSMPIPEITIVNAENSEICKNLFTKFMPESILVAISNPSHLEKLAKFPFFTGKIFDDKTSVYVCKNFSCSLPLKSIYEIDLLI